MPHRRQPLDMLLPILGIVGLVLLAEALKLAVPLALGAFFGMLYLALLARQVFLPASLPNEAPSCGAKP